MNQLYCLRMITSWIWYIFTFVYLHLLPCVLRERKEVVKCLMCWSYRLSGPQSFLAWLRGYIQLSEFGVWKLKLRLFNENKPQKHQQNKFCFRLRDQLSVPCLTADVLVSSEGVTPNITQRLMERLFGLEAVYVLVVNLSTTLDSYLRYWPLFISEKNKPRKGIQVINIENNANFMNDAVLWWKSGACVLVRRAFSVFWPRANWSEWKKVDIPDFAPICARPERGKSSVRECGLT